jgi:hypothetical protein
MDLLNVGILPHHYTTSLPEDFDLTMTSPRRWRQHGSPKRWHLTTSLHGVKTWGPRLKSSPPQKPQNSNCVKECSRLMLLLNALLVFDLHAPCACSNFTDCNVIMMSDKSFVISVLKSCIYTSLLCPFIVLFFVICPPHPRSLPLHCSVH